MRGVGNRVLNFGQAKFAYKGVGVGEGGGPEFWSTKFAYKGDGRWG